MRPTPLGWASQLFLIGLMLWGPPSRSEVKTLNRQGEKIHLGRYDFRDEEGQLVNLANFFGPKKPVFLVPVFYDCPGVCTATLNQLFIDLKRLCFNPGRALEVVAISINPKETSRLAKNKKMSYLKRFQYESYANGFHFLVGDEGQIAGLTSELGFIFEKNGDQFNHPGAVYLLTPEGRISKLLTGTEKSLKKLHNYVFEAANGRKISNFEKMILACKVEPK